MNTLATRLITGTLAAFVSLGVLAPTTAHADDAPTYTVTGALPSDATVTQDVALCATACVTAEGLTSPAMTTTDGTPAGNFSLASVPNGTYRLAVNYTASDYKATGYLKFDTRGGITVTSDFDSAYVFIVDGEDAAYGSMKITKPTPPVVATPTAQAKPVHGLRRITHRGGKVGWLAEDKVRLTNQGARHYVYMQIRKNGVWRNVIRQTTTRNGEFYFDAVTRKQHRLYQTKSYKIGKLPNSYSIRVVVPGDKYFAPTVSNSWTVTW